jgi:uncharacterized membrane protein HdeD (DUF308 family)
MESSSQQVGPYAVAGESAYSESGAEKAGTGWIAYSGIMLILAGLLNLVDGLWAIDHRNSSVIGDQTEELLFYSDSLQAWGWFYVVTGGILLVAGACVFSRVQWARWVGIFAASVSVVVNMMWVFVFPIAALVLILLGTLVIYGLAVYGGRESAY